MKTQNLLLLALAGGGVIYFLTRKSTIKPLPSAEKPAEQKPKPVEPKPIEPKPAEYIPVDKGFTYDCKSLNVTDKDKMKTFIGNRAKIIAEKLNITSKKTLVNVSFPIFVNAVITDVNKTCLKNPELMKGNEKIIQVVLSAYYYAAILDEIKKIEIISQTDMDKINENFAQKAISYFKLTQEEIGQFFDLFAKILPSEVAYHFDCNTLTIKNEEMFDQVVGIMFSGSLLKGGFIENDPNTLFNINLDIILKDFINKLNPKCTIDNISDDVFIIMMATVIAAYRIIVDHLFPQNINAVTKSEEKINQLYQTYGVTEDGINEIEALIEKLNINPDFEEIKQTKFGQTLSLTMK